MGAYHITTAAVAVAAAAATTAAATTTTVATTTTATIAAAVAEVAVSDTNDQTDTRSEAGTPSKLVYLLQGA
jgi:hypothetical protein